MIKISRYIVKHYKSIIIGYIFLVLASLIGMRYVDVEYDLSSYLPKTMNSIKGKGKLSSDFGINGTASLMIKSIDLYFVQNIKNQIKELPEVKGVVWLDDVEDIHKPVEFMDSNMTKGFIQDDYSLLQIQFHHGNDELATRTTLDKIDKLVDKEHYIGGAAAVTKDMQDTTSREMVYYTIMAFVIITIILLISSSAYYEPLLFFVTIGAAIALNMGTNLIFGKVSSNTHSVASILQLAVSMDYSIFLLHRFHEETKDRTKSDAMEISIIRTFSSVSSSAMTTVFGFLALLAMKYGLGRDMGLVLAKGVFLSLLTVVTLMPCLILAVDEKLGKYGHRILLPDFNRRAKFLIGLRAAAIALALIIVVPAYLGHSKLQYYYSTEKTLSQSSKSALSNKKIQEVFGRNNQMLLIVPKGDKVKLNELSEGLNTIDNVDYVQNIYSLVDKYLPDEIIPQEARDNFESEKLTYVIINMLTASEGKEAAKALEEVKKTADKYYNEWYLTGEGAVYYDLQQITSKDFNRVNIISTLLIGMVLLITFKSLLLPLLLIFVIQLGIWINLSIPYFQGTSLNFISFIIIGAIQLGATVDYAILFTSRFKENLEKLTPLMAMMKTIGDTGRAVLTSALILIAGTLSVSAITTISSASELTMLISRGAFLSLILVYTLLPGVLLVFNPLIKYTTIGWPKTVKTIEGEGEINEEKKNI